MLIKANVTMARRPPVIIFMISLLASMTPKIDAALSIIINLQAGNNTICCRAGRAGRLHDTFLCLTEYGMPFSAGAGHTLAMLTLFYD